MHQLRNSRFPPTSQSNRKNLRVSIFGWVLFVCRLSFVSSQNLGMFKSAELSQGFLRTFLGLSLWFLMSFDFLTSFWGISTTSKNFLKNFLVLFEDFLETFWGPFEEFLRTSLGLSVDFLRNFWGVFWGLCQIFLKNFWGISEDLFRNCSGLTRGFLRTF